MKQNKKLLALLLVLVIAFTSLALVACNKDKGKESGWYISAGQGMGACLNIANEKKRLRPYRQSNVPFVQKQSRRG